MTESIDMLSMDIDANPPSSVASDSTTSSSNKSQNDQPSSPDEYNGQECASPFTRYLDREQEGIYHLQEAVATTLFNASPKLLASFIDPMVPTFKAIFKSDKQLVIWRKGNAVFIGIFENHTLIKAFGFQHLVGVAIGYDGSWRVFKGAGNAFCEPRWTEVWTGVYRCFGGVNRMVVEGEGMEVEKVQRAALLAAGMLEGQFWASKVGVKMT